MKNFVRIPNSIARDGSLSLCEKAVLIAIMSHEHNAGWPSLKQLVIETGASKRSIIRAIAKLVKDGYLEKNTERGHKNQYSLGPKVTGDTGAPGDEMTPVTPGNQTSIPDGTSTSATVAPVTPQTPAPAKAKSSAKDSLRQDEDKKPPIVPLEKGDATRKPHKSKKQPTTFEQVQQSIDSLDTDKFVKAYPGVDVLGEFEKFRDHYLGGNDLRTGKPLWQKWTDWDRAFHTWCRNAKKWAQERASPEKDAPRLPVLKGLDEEGNLIYE